MNNTGFTFSPSINAPTTDIVVDVLNEWTYKNVQTIFTQFPLTNKFDWLFKTVDTFDTQLGYKIRIFGNLAAYSWIQVERGYHVVGMVHNKLPSTIYTFNSLHNITSSISKIDNEREDYPGYFDHMFKAFRESWGNRLGLLIYLLFKGSSSFHSNKFLETTVNNFWNSNGSTDGFAFYQYNNPNAEIVLGSDAEKKKAKKHPLYEEIQKTRKVLTQSNVIEIKKESNDLKKEIKGLNLDWNEGDQSNALLRLYSFRQTIARTIDDMTIDAMKYTGLNSKTVEKEKKKFENLGLQTNPQDLVVIVDHDSVRDFEQAINYAGDSLGSFFNGMPTGPRYIVYPYAEKNTAMIFHKDLVQLILKMDETQTWEGRYPDQRFTNINSRITFLLATIDFLPSAYIKYKT